jgi:hypothetical protein
MLLRTIVARRAETFWSRELFFARRGWPAEPAPRRATRATILHFIFGVSAHGQDVGFLAAEFLRLVLADQQVQLRSAQCLDSMSRSRKSGWARRP